MKTGPLVWREVVSPLKSKRAPWSGGKWHSPVKSITPLGSARATVTSPDKMAESIWKSMHSHGLCYFSQFLMDPSLDIYSTWN